jgi:hypothetical protein
VPQIQLGIWASLEGFWGNGSRSEILRWPSQELLDGDKYVTLSILLIAIKAITTALIEIVDAKRGGEGHKRVNNLAKRLRFDFRERWKPDERNQFQEGGVVTTRGRGIWQAGLHPLSAFASTSDPRTKQPKAYSKRITRRFGLDFIKKLWSTVSFQVVL